MTLPELRTARLVLRSFEDRDASPFATINADPRVMEHFPSTLTRAESDADRGVLEEVNEHEWTEPREPSWTRTSLT